MTYLQQRRPAPRCKLPSESFSALDSFKSQSALRNINPRIQFQCIRPGFLVAYEEGGLSSSKEQINQEVRGGGE